MLLCHTNCSSNEHSAVFMYLFDYLCKSVLEKLYITILKLVL